LLLPADTPTGGIRHLEVRWDEPSIRLIFLPNALHLERLTAMILHRAFRVLAAASAIFLVLSLSPSWAQDAVVFSIDEEKISEDGTIAIPIRVDDFENVTGVQFSLTWNPALLQFETTGSYNLPGLNTANFGTPQSEYIDEGTLTFAWDDPEANGEALADGSILFTVTFTPARSSDERADIAFVDNPTQRAVYIDFSEASFVAVSGGAVLPVELTSFVGHATGREVLLQWETQSESQNAGFSVEYRSTPSSGARLPYQTAGFEPGAGTTQAPQQYTYRITDLEPGAYQFRLTQVDIDGTATPGPPVEVQVTLETTYELSPPDRNPFQMRTHLELTTQKAQHVAAVAYNALGQRVAELHRGPLPAHTPKQITFEGAGLPSGVYWIRVSGESFTAVRTVVLAK
jgi:hypothetical protein